MGSFVPKYVRLPTPQLDERKRQVLDRLFSDTLAHPSDAVPQVQYACPLRGIHVGAGRSMH